MSYATDVIFHIPFDAEPLAEGVTSNFLTEHGSTPVIVDGVFGSAWQMADDSWAASADPIFTTTTTAATIGFWLKSVNPGVVTDPNSNITKSLKMPVMSKATFAVVSNVVSTVLYTFMIWEETQQDGQNILKVKIRGTKSAVLVEAELDSSPYQVGVFHHFWIVYDGIAETFQLFVDTIEDVAAVLTGTIPSTLTVNSSSFLEINNNVPGNNLWEIARNQGVIDDLIIFKSSKSNSSTISRAANKGAIYVADTVLADFDEIDQGAVFDDPGTAQITSVYSNRGKLYVARSDGKLLRGNKLLWESRREFSNDKEANSLTTVNKGDGGSVRVSLGSLKIQDKIVRV